jgi:hypothetical protein
MPEHPTRCSDQTRLRMTSFGVSTIGHLTSEVNQTVLNRYRSGMLWKYNAHRLI